MTRGCRRISFVDSLRFVVEFEGVLQRYEKVDDNGGVDMVPERELIRITIEADP